MNEVQQIRLLKGRSGPTFGRHPWVFSNALGRPDLPVADGTSVEVLSDRDEFLGYGIYNSKSDIRVRIYSWNQEREIDKKLWFEKIERAIQLRKKVLKLQESTTACRLIFSEGDEISGLVVDQFGDYLVVQITSLAVFKWKAEILEALVEFTQAKGIYLRAEKNILKAEGVAAEDEIIFGSIPDEPIEICENGIFYRIDLKQGQKTGFYADQRENRKHLTTLASGRRVLDLCTYTGSFALHLSKAGASEVVGVDSSGWAIEIAKENAKRNACENISFVESDIFDFCSSEQSQFDLIVLDPPRFAPSRGAREKALRSYFKINSEALRLLRPGGIFVSFSCSHQIGRSDFNSTLASVFRRAGRDAQILYQGGQPGDHPILTACPETQYLKSLVCLVH